MINTLTSGSRGKMANFAFFSDINECVPDPCQNGGTCEDLVGSYRCSCKTGYSGDNCQTGDNICNLRVLHIHYP